MLADTTGKPPWDPKRPRGNHRETQHTTAKLLPSSADGVQEQPQHASLKY